MVEEVTMFRARTEGIATQELGDEVVILDLRTSSYLLLNAAGTILWPALAEPVSIAGLAAVLTAEFELDEERAIADATAFVQDLLDLGVVERAGLH